MALDIKKIARKATVVAEIMENREKGDTEELIKRKSSVTINDCEMCTLTNDEGEEENVWAYTIKEEPEKFYFAGYVLKKIFENILAECEGDYEELYSAVIKQGLTVKFGQKKTRDGKRVVTTVEVV